MNRRLATAVAVLLGGAAVAPLLAGRAAAAADTEAGTVRLATYQRHVAELASDAFSGRKPSTEGERRTVAYLVEEFRRLGLKPGNAGSFEQPVPIVEHTFGSDATLHIGTAALAYPDAAVIGTRRLLSEAAIADSEVVFAGYGVVAPEYGWNDYAGLNVRGKTVIVLINDPGFERGDPNFFRGRAMTYYGRWTYKFEEAARQGAAAVLIVHETEPAAYPWEVVRNGWTGPQLGLQAAGSGPERAMIEGWITRDAADSIARQAGTDFASLKQAAGRNGFQARSLGLRATAKVRAAIRRSVSPNVVAVLPGTDLAAETVIYCAHWDHLGMSLAGADRVFNGAVDNATGVAGLLAIAEAFATSRQRPRRSVMFLAVTAEEAGLLGSEHYALHPIVPLASTVAVLNMDAIAFGGPTRDVTVVGSGSSELEAYLARAAARQQRVLVPEPTPEKGFFYRSDHFNFAKVGVPALYIKLGIDDVEKGRAAGAARDDEYYAVRYHKVGDEYRAGVDDLRGGLQDVQLMHWVGAELTAEAGFPNWHPGNEFRPIRDRSRPGQRNDGGRASRAGVAASEPQHPADRPHAQDGEIGRRGDRPVRE
jgi:Zn-dependent M28 family amino/carboxypeptidase